MNLSESKTVVTISALIITASYLVWMWSNYEAARLARLQIAAMQANG